jgi:hypothetical protein
VLQEDGLNKTAIGDYLGEKKDFNEAVLRDVTQFKPTIKINNCLLFERNIFLKIC